jgi:serine/threonine protein kinase
MDIIKKVKNNNIIIEKPISSECEDLIRKLLSHDKNKRLKIKDVFNHPWTLYFQNELFNYKKVIRASDSTKPTSTVSRFSSDNYNRNCIVS